MDAVRVITRAERDLLGEGPFWSVRHNALFWVDILGCAVNRFSLADESVTRWQLAEPIGWLIERENAPGFMAGLKSGFAELEFDPLRIVHVLNPEPGLADHRMNDAKADGSGRIWAGTMAMGGDRADGALYRFGADRKAVRVDAGYTIPNGPAFSPDGRRMYHADSALRVVYCYDVDRDGEPGERRVFVRFEPDWGLPDGMTVDSDGGLWVAHWGAGRVSRFDETGSLDCFIELPARQITSCVFAGRNLDRLFVTSAAQGLEHEPYAGALFEVRTSRRGLAPNLYRG